MEESTLKFAQKNLDIIAQENGFTTINNDKTLYIELRSGRCFELSENEIRYQAIEYLKSEISNIQHNS
jgi:hypothetical protein